MSRTSTSVAERLGAFFAVDDEWERPAPTARQRRNDVWVALATWVWGAVGMELLRSVADPRYVDHPWWVQHLLIALGTVPLVWRRSHPLLVGGGLMLHMFFVGITVPEVMRGFTMQCVYVFALFTAVAWARNRRPMLAMVGGVLVLMFGWIAWQYALGTAVQEMLDRSRDAKPPSGLFPQIPAAVALDVVMNAVYFGGGIVGGQAAWRQARSRALLEDQSRQLAEQADELADRKVVEERLRIARELHDVVAHHVSVMGVQAAAARRVLDRNPQAAADALTHVEESSRQAVGEMRGLLGTLRRTDRRTDRGADGAGSGPGAASDAGPGSEDRAPQPGVEQVATLVQEAAGPGFAVTYQVVEDRPGALTEVPMPVGLSVYRTVQEALANVRRHSTAHAASVVVRLGAQGGHRYVEAEVLDEGRPRTGTSGSGLGLLGMRERIASHGGTSEIGPRATGGYRVRVRFPLPG
ncbi:sensor histidine kinase [Arsenicicoccus sp. oral taxon 190]|uniref:sensor histidine kinase n=1 Tax=Arsenicicoccus sp. oral taxon 190 TaxID=1658671 RepID=UPI00067A0005|nr:histidine kinase [Arsenicicoccus sp. oral taxon 190]AKT50630.1 histidine kinase [Arsenicicoccus sp. oral taxon 190]